VPDARKAAAENALQKALALQPDNGQTHLALGAHLLATTCDYAAIRREFEVARRTLPNAVKLFAMLAMVESRQGEWRDALADYEKAIALSPKQLSLILGQCEIYEYHRHTKNFIACLPNRSKPAWIPKQLPSRRR
jgi:tetratricopeptide (TPR) repeat protein